MKKAAFVLALSVASASFLQSSAWSTSSLLMQMPAILAASQKSDTTQILIGENGVITAFKGKTLRSNIKIYHGYALADSTTYEYSTVIVPSGLSVSADGVISYAVPASADTQSIPLSLQVKDKATGKSYTKNIQLVVMATEIIASGTVGPTGGQIADELEEVVVTVPEGSVEGQTLIEVLRAVDENGYYAYTINASAPLLKILQMRLPDPILRKAPEGTAALKNYQPAQQSAFIEKAASTREVSSSWFSWRIWGARYVEIITTAAENRLRSDIPISSEPASKNINNYIKKSAALLSLCSKESYDTNCEEKEPVLFVHGYSVGGELGGGEGTWGKLPELIAAEGYAVFEFTWRTNARFVDVAANLADAIKLIQEKSRKKVHIIAHSFGGLVSRAYLQNYATGRPYQNNVQSLITLGTPHSGIFDTDGTYHGLFFKKGQDSIMFEGCMQISCQQAGEPTPNAWTVIHEQDSGADLDISDWLGIDKNPGELIAQIQNTSGEHGLPVDTLVLIGLPAFIEYYHSGDGLITYAGQRFSNTWKNSKIQKTPSSFGNGYVAERILWVSNYDPDAVPDAKPSSDLIARWFDNNNFRGYFHSTAVPEYINILRQGAAEAKVVSSSNIGGTNEPHAALTEIKAWLKPAETAEPLNVTLNLQVVNANTQQPVAGAEVYFNANGTSCSSSAERYGVTDASGKLTKELPFYPLSKYTALVIAAGYKAGEFDTGYQTGFTPGLSGTEFGTIKLQAGKVPTVTYKTGRIWMDRNLGASRVATISSWDWQARGDVYQWGRLADGHQKLINFTRQLSATDAPGHDQYICMSLDYDYTDWRIPKNDNLWQGVNGINNPCPTGFRLPTANEWQKEMDTWVSKDAAGAFASPLKLTSSDRVHMLCNSISYFGDWAYWSSTIQGNYAAMLTPNGIEYTFRAAGHPVRCIKDEVEQVPTVISATGRVWMDRNLGASRVATSMTDTAAYGDLYQWGRLADGHEKRTSSTTNTSSSSDVPGHGNHIIRSDWRIPQNNNLWQGLNGTNNPCPSGFRLPTANEWQEEIDSWSFKNSTGAFTSPLKLVAAGYRSFLDGLIRVDGYPAQYWTSSIINSPYPDWYVSQEVSFDIWGASAGGDGMNRGAAMSVRCIKD